MNNIFNHWWPAIRECIKCGRTYTGLAGGTCSICKEARKIVTSREEQRLSAKALAKAAEENERLWVVE